MMPNILSKFKKSDNTGPEHMVLKNLLLSRTTLTRSELRPINEPLHSEDLMDLDEFEKMMKKEIEGSEEMKENGRN